MYLSIHTIHISTSRGRFNILFSINVELSETGIAPCYIYIYIYIQYIDAARRQRNFAKYVLKCSQVVLNHEFAFKNSHLGINLYFTILLKG